MVSGGVQGRTNEIFPSKWLRLISPSNTAGPDSASDLVQAALEARTVLDISSNPALWGGHMRATDAPLMALGATDLERAQDEQQAHDLVQAHLIEILCAIGREHLDFYFLRLRQPLHEFQISGALIALESCRQEGNVRFSGIAGESIPASLGVLQFHDAFEAVLVDANAASAPLKLLAKGRRMSIITRTQDPLFEPEEGQGALVQASTSHDVRVATQPKATVL